MFSTLVLGVLASPALAPVPPKPKPAVEVVLRTDARKNPLDDDFATVAIQNNTDKEIDLLSSLPGGVLVLLDGDVRNEADKRISGDEFYWATIASPFAEPRRIGTIKPGKSLVVDMPLLHPVGTAKLVPGKYKVRVRFRYGTFDAVSDWATIAVTAEHLKAR